MHFMKYVPRIIVCGLANPGIDGLFASKTPNL